jgi:hypothetical protein
LREKLLRSQKKKRRSSSIDQRFWIRALRQRPSSRLSLVWTGTDNNNGWEQTVTNQEINRRRIRIRWGRHTHRTRGRGLSITDPSSGCHPRTTAIDKDDLPHVRPMSHQRPSCTSGLGHGSKSTREGAAPEKTGRGRPSPASSGPGLPRGRIVREQGRYRSRREGVGPPPVASRGSRAALRVDLAKYDEREIERQTVLGGCVDGEIWGIETVHGCISTEGTRSS